MGTPPDCVFGHWIHSREEDTADLVVYRPRDHPLPRSRGRRALEIHPDGTLVRYDIGPADGPLEVRGRWRADTPDRLLVDYEGGRNGEELVIVSCDAQVLKLRRGVGSG